MGRRCRGVAVVVALVGACGFLMSGPGTGCGSFALETVAANADFCFIFDCQDGVLGGTIDPCPTQMEGGNANLFVDCPQEEN